ncbi:alpha/beta hydrolase [Bradyrhizobium sp. CCBAU 45321]|uniref:alpha/beta hydrolase n=1 Tax=Bradyrhizobium sp. CCBAU 45321 TaxID=1641878 RepID=UPI002302DA9B|nr:alpha/beta hydrolase [Bradyrhizobium sp. CCBAU 45321]
MRQILLIIGLLLAWSVGATAQVSNLPQDLRLTLEQIGSRFQSDLATHIPATLRAFQPVLKAAPKEGIIVTRDEAYGPASKQVLDVYQPANAKSAPVLIFLHGGAHVFGDKNGYGEIYGNVGYWFARNGVLTLNATYRLAPEAMWPSGAEDIDAMIKWARDNVARFGGDPTKITLMGHSAGATHVASYIFDKSLQPVTGPGLVAAVLISGRYRLNFEPGEPNAKNAQAYFGTDGTKYLTRSPLTHVPDSPKIPVLIGIAEFENPTIDKLGAELFLAICQRDGNCPRFIRLLGHNHMSEIAAFNTPDEQLGREILDFIRAIH